MYANRSISFYFILAVLIGLFVLQLTSRAQAQQRNVTIKNVVAEGTGSNIVITWETGTELDTAGFFVERGTGNFCAGEGTSSIITVTYQGSPTQMIPAKGDNSSYEVFDESATPGTRYWYALRERETDGTETLLCGPSNEFTDDAEVNDVPNAGVDVMPVVSDISTTAGTPTAHTLTIRNTGNRTDEIVLSIDSSTVAPPVLSTLFLVLEPGESETVTATVTLPANAAPGTVATATIEARSNNVDPDVSDTVDLFTRIAGVKLYVPLLIDN